MIAPMGPVGPGYTGAFMAALNLAVSSICCSKIGRAHV